MNEKENRESEMDYSQKSPNSIRSSKSKKERLVKFLKDYEIDPVDVMDVAFELMDKDLGEVRDKINARREKPEKDIWDEYEDRWGVNDLSYGPMCDVPNIDIYKCAMVRELEMLNNSGMLNKSDQEELKTLRREVAMERSNMEVYWKRSFDEKKSYNPRH